MVKVFTSKVLVVAASTFLLATVIASSAIAWEKYSENEMASMHWDRRVIVACVPNNISAIAEFCSAKTNGRWHQDCQKRDHGYSSWEEGAATVCRQKGF